MKDYYPDKHCLLTIILLIILSEALIWFTSWKFIPERFAVAVTIIRITAIVIGVILGFIYFPLFFRTVKYTLTETEIIRTSGVFIKIHQSIKYSSIQYVTVVTTPLSQYTGLNFIIYFVYGGQLRLLFLDHEDAMEILQLSGIREEE